MSKLNVVFAGFSQKFVAVILFVLVGLYSCGGGNSDEKNTTVKDEEETTSSSSSSNSSTSSISKENWDAVLQDYEKFVDQYIEFMKKLKKGDASVVQNTTELMTKALDLTKKLDKAKEKELTPAQSAKFKKLQEKLENAAAKGLNN